MTINRRYRFYMVVWWYEGKI